MHFQDLNGRWSSIETDTFSVIVDDPDLTGLIVNPDASLDRKGWTIDGSLNISKDDHYSGEENKYFHLTGEPTTMTQTITGLPAGTYMLTMMGRCQDGATLEININGSVIAFNEDEWISKVLVFSTNGEPFEINITKTGNGAADLDDLQLSINSTAAMNVKLPESVNISDYQGMTLELSTSDWKMEQTITSENSCTFNGLSTSQEYSLTLKNQFGMLIANRQSITLHTGINTIILDDLAAVHNVTIRVLTDNNQDVTSQTTITWYDDNNNKLLVGTNISGIPEGTMLAYDVKLSNSLADRYQQPTRQTHTVDVSNNELTIILNAIPVINLTGQVVNENYEPIAGAMIRLTQWVNGSKQESKSITTDADGKFEISAYNDSTEIIVSAEGYINQTLTWGNYIGNYLGTIVMKKITGTIISLNISYQETVPEGNEPIVMDWYSDMRDIKFTVYNSTQGRDVTDYSVQDNEIIVPVALNHGDCIVVSANSLNGQFAEARAETRIGVNDSADVVLRFIEYGGMDISYQSINDDNLLAFVYDTTDKMVSRVTFSGNRQKFTGMPAGTYHLVTMGYNGMTGSITSLSNLEELGLEEGVDYITKQITVQNGFLTAVDIEDVPEMDPSKFSYTSANTSYLANKSRLVAGKYITMTARVDFSSQYANQVNNVSLIIDIPDDCVFIDNSVVIGSRLIAYVLNGNKLTIPLTGEELNSRIRFCMIPTHSGVFTTAAYAKFDFRGEKMQSIGSAVFEATDIAIVVPSSTRKTLIPVSGITTPEAVVNVYDNDVFIGSTKALKDGNWRIDCELNTPYNLSTHKIYAEIHGTNGVTLTTGSKDCYYDMNIIEAKSVLMTFYNGWLKKNVDVTFDFEKGTTSSNSYQFYTATDFTFIADLTVNDTTSVRGVTFFVYTNQDEVRQLQGFFDKTLNRWVAVSKFDSNNLPVNLSVDVDYYTNIVADRQELDDRIMAFKANLDEEKAILEELDNSFDAGDDDGEKSIYEKMYDIATSANINETELQSLINQLSSTPLIDSELSDEELDAEFQELMEEMEESMKHFEKDSIYAAFNINGNLRDVYFPTPPFSGTFSIDDLSEQFTIESVGNLNEFELIQMGYDLLETTDGTKVYCLVTDSEVSYIDTKEGINYTLQFQNQVQNLAKSLGYDIERIKDYSNLPFADKLDMAKAILNTLYNAITAPKINKKVAEEIAKQLHALSTLMADIYISCRKWVEDSWNTYTSNSMKEIDNKILKCQKKLYIQNKRILIAHAAHEADPHNQGKLLSLVKELEKSNKLEKKIKEYGALKIKLEKVTKIVRKQINKIPKSPKVPKVNTISKVVGKLFGGLTVFLEINDLIEFLDKASEDCLSWLQLLYLIDDKIPCPKNPETALHLQQNIQFDATDLLSVYLRNILAKNEAIRIDIVSLFIPELPPAELVLWFASGILNSYSEWSQLKAINRKFLDKRVEYTYAINNLQCYEREPEPRPGGGGSNSGNSGSSSSGKRSDPPQPPFPPVSPIHDPSGYVYEAVTSNRLEGVTATIYSKSEDPKRWNAMEYSQVNPIITDETGLYAWDVPQGLWQVRFEKEDYETTQTAWLPVPPPQLEINIPMTQGISPEVVKAYGVQSGITLTFSKYMRPESFKKESVSVIRDEKTISGHLNMVNLEKDPYTNNEYASKIKFEPNTAFNIGDVVFITVQKEVESYAGTPMTDEVTLRVVIEPEVSGINVDSLIVVEYGRTANVDIYVQPADAVIGKVLTIDSGSSIIASVNKAETILDENGHAQITIKGELPGGTSLILKLADSDMETISEVNVVISEEVVRTPKASVRSGSTILYGDQLALTCATPGATIYYTLDGSCPCDESTRIKYSDAITITEDVTIKAIAVKEGLTDSDIATFIYVVDKASGIKTTANPNYRIKLNNRELSIIGAQGAACRIFDGMGRLVAKRNHLNHEDYIRLPYGIGVFIVNIDLRDNTSYIYKIVSK